MSEALTSAAIHVIFRITMERFLLTFFDKLENPHYALLFRSTVAAVAFLITFHTLPKDIPPTAGTVITLALILGFLVAAPGLFKGRTS